MSVFLLKMSLFLFDDAKVRRFSEPAMSFAKEYAKNMLSFDVNQVLVCEHKRFVCENRPLFLLLGVMSFSRG